MSATEHEPRTLGRRRDGPTGRQFDPEDAETRSEVVEWAYAEHGTAVHSMATNLCGTAAGADITQDVFLRLWQRPERFDPQRGSLRSYLLTDCRGRAIDAVRSETARRRRESAEIIDLAPHRNDDVEDHVVRNDQRAQMRVIIDRLPPHEREAIVTAYFGGCTYEAAALILDVPEGTVKSRIRRGLLRLHVLIEEQRSDSEGYETADLHSI